MKRILIALAAWLGAGMVSAETLPNLTAASALSGAELVYCAQGNADRKCTVDQFKTYINATTVTAPSGTGFIHVTSGAVDAASIGETGTGNVIRASALSTVATTGSASDLGTGTLPAARLPALTGDVTSSAGAAATTLATVNSNVGSFTNASVTVNAKGLVTAAASGAAPEVPLTFSTGLTRSTNTVTVNASQSIATLSNLTNNGLVTTSGGAGTLGVTVPGSGVLTALGVNVGSAGAVVVNGGALGTPSSGVATNLTGTASGLTAGNVTTNANLTGPITSVGNATAVASQTGTGSTFVMSASPTVTGTLSSADHAIVSGSLSMSGNQSAASWTTSGLRYKNTAATLTDTTSSGTVAAVYNSVWGGNTNAASSSTTITNLYDAYFRDPATCGTNVTCTNKWALGADSVKIGLAGGLYGDASNALSLRSGANSQTLYVYDGYTDASNYGRFAVGALGTINSLTNRVGLYYQHAGTGSVRNVDFGTDSVASVSLVTSGVHRWFVDSSGNFMAVANNTYDIGANGVTAPRTGYFGTSIVITGSTLLTAPAAATLQHGAADAASPVAQTVTVQSVATGTSNTAGANFTIAGSKGTGSAAGGSLVFQVAPAGGSGTSQNALVSAMTLSTTALTLGSAVVAPASSGTRYLCISTGGVVTSSASACSGT